ncbi:hypothetical protein A0257_14415 [Hymenobacter psoromatis]|nr:hypothetical protein A0257_14415 [Hymenobacter psoromatis]
MNLRATFLQLACLAGLLGTGPAAQAQQPAAPAAPVATDVLLLTTGQEVSGRVLTITPSELTYLPATPTPPDTLRLPIASVFLVRYANGTREVLNAPAPVADDDPTPPALRGLSTPQRQQLGQRDALRCYRASGPYWGALGSTLYLGPLLGLAPTAVISSQWVRDYNLKAPTPALLKDASYAQGYRQQANRTKHRRTWGGYGVATAVYVVLIAALVAGAN